MCAYVSRGARRKEIEGIVAKKGDRRDFSGYGDVVCTAEIGRRGQIRRRWLAVIVLARDTLTQIREMIVDCTSHH